MQVQAYLNFGGRCEEALAFYKDSIGAKVDNMMRWKESPDQAMTASADYAEKIMNATFKIGSTTLMADDGMRQEKIEYKGFTLAIEVANDAEANASLRRSVRAEKYKCRSRKHSGRRRLAC